MGYHRAGFDVTGVDINPQPRYPFAFHQADALEFVAAHGREFDVIHASPPCQAYSLARNNGCHSDAPALIPQTRERLEQTGRPYVIENVIGAPLINPIMLCGASFGLGVAGLDLPRHRLFELHGVTLILVPRCQHRSGKTIGVYGNGTNKYHLDLLGRCVTADELRVAMGIKWMTRRELSQAIPPAYTHFIGSAILGQLQSHEAA